MARSPGVRYLEDVRALAITVLCASMLAAPAGATATGGLRGVVMRGPVTPVCHAGTSCDAPAKSVTITFTRNGLSRSVITDAQGRYAIRLAAGTWAVRIPSAGKFGFRPQSAFVRAGIVRIVNFSVDTGIR